MSNTGNDGQRSNGRMRRSQAISILDDHEHMRRRKNLGPGYVGNAHVEACINRQCARLVDLIERKFVSTSTEYRPMDLTAVSFFFAMDCVGDLSFGKPLGCLDEGRDVHKFMKERLTSYKTLTGGVVFVDAIPKSASGKILKRVLKDELQKEKEKARSSKL